MKIVHYDQENLQEDFDAIVESFNILFNNNESLRLPQTIIRNFAGIIVLRNNIEKVIKLSHEQLVVTDNDEMIFENQIRMCKSIAQDLANKINEHRVCEGIKEE